MSHELSGLSLQRLVFLEYGRWYFDHAELNRLVGYDIHLYATACPFNGDPIYLDARNIASGRLPEMYLMLTCRHVTPAKVRANEIAKVPRLGTCTCRWSCVPW